jgi:hypothetical protein
MKRVAVVALLVMLLLPGVALAGPSTDAALGLGAFAVFNQILSGTGIFGAFVHPAPVAVARPVVVAPPPVYVAPRPVYVVPRPVYVVPQPVYVVPQPVYVVPQPVAVYPTPGYYRGWVRYVPAHPHGGWRHHH